ncbi:MAG: TonB-dependent receptor [Myxococcales bacterium]|nr:TonB-dependent receptor [Myxococcales bacterium]
MSPLRSCLPASLAALAVSLGGRAGAEPRKVYETTVSAPTVEELPEERASTTVRRSDLDRRQPSSTPEALRYEPGVFVQQTSHGQGSAFIRGLTGQQTLLLFDGVRLNNATFRQGPNQYLFTLDLHTVDTVEVMRGGGSTRFGSDALGGVINVRPVEPPGVAASWVMAGESDANAGGSDGSDFASPAPARRWFVAPRLFARGATADTEHGGRAQVEAGVALPHGLELRFVGGAGAREVGLLESGGPIVSPENGLPTTARENFKKEVPRFGSDGRTQLGTGFKEVTGDGRLVLGIGARHAVKLAAYLYRQYDAPRTDQCAPPEAPFDECLTYEQQFRTLVYASWDGPLGAAASRARATVSWQRWHERKRLERPGSFYLHRGNDDVDSLGASLNATTGTARPRTWLGLRASWGADGYFDTVGSDAQVELSDLKLVRVMRGQYVDGAIYFNGGAFLDGELLLGRRVTVRAGGRVSAIVARSPELVDAREMVLDTPKIDRSWFPVVGHAGVEVRATGWLHALVNVDHSFRAPNLDDLVARQPTGAGFQCGNPLLDPERATSFEAGLRLRTSPVTADAWLYQTLLHDLVMKQRSEGCPGGGGFRSILQLTNARGLSQIRGAEGAVKVRLPYGLNGRATVAYAWGEGPAPESLPVSRVPPLNGTVEINWSLPRGLAAGGALRWATKQDRLAFADKSDSRIPLGGTPGFAVVDLRASYRVGNQLAISAVFENVLDAAYRYHGSSVNGAGRGFILSMEVMPTH